MAQLAVQKAAPSGTVIAYVAAAAGGDTIPASTRRALRVKNANAAGINVTITSQRTCSQGFDHDLVVAVAAGAEKVLGPFDPNRFADEDGLVHVAYSAVADITVAVEEV